MYKFVHRIRNQSVVKLDRFRSVVETSNVCFPDYPKIKLYDTVKNGACFKPIELINYFTHCYVVTTLISCIHDKSIIIYESHRNWLSRIACRLQWKNVFPRFDIQIIIIVVETVWIQSTELYIFGLNFKRLENSNSKKVNQSAMCAYVIF